MISGKLLNASMIRPSLRNWWSYAFEKGIYPLKSLIEDPKWRKKTRQEIAFIRRTLDLPKGSKILDVGCGVGRHTVELAGTGYDLTGVDISARYLAEAKRRLERRGFRAGLLHGDMRRLKFDEKFDAAINLFTSFGYFPRPDDDLLVLQGVRKALRPGGLLLLDTVNGTRMVHLMAAAARMGLRNNFWEQLEDDSFCLQDWVLLPNRNAFRTRWVFLSHGTRKEMISFIRIFSKAVISSLFHRAELDVVRIYGDMNGSRYHPRRSPRLVVLARKPL